MADPSDVWVIDSSSIIVVREQVSRAHEKKVFRALSSLADGSQLVWPPEVTQELEAALIADSAVAWIKARRSSGERSPKLETVKSVLHKAPALVDADATREQADPYVVALALEIASDSLFPPRVTIVTEDRRDKPNKLSLATAAGLVGIPTVPLRAFLVANPYTVECWRYIPAMKLLISFDDRRDDCDPSRNQPLAKKRPVNFDPYSLHAPAPIGMIHHPSACCRPDP